MTKIALATPVLLIPSVAAAHPEHFSGGSYGLAHFLSDPFHLAFLLAGTLVGLATWRVLRRRMQAVRSSSR